MIDFNYEYIIQCRANTLTGITPFNTEKYSTPEYQNIIEIGKKCIQKDGLIHFSLNLQGDQYFVGLWTAHIIYEHGNPEPALQAQCIEIIKEY
ncbi:MAG: hypothetical protein EOP46_02040 [Sphingobacteriaceae bacterium]|nr:MAG: hypothetical protein EOP46_02040 [Sphingobacteriaceae bacterium]